MALDLGTLVASQAPRDIAVITAEILDMKQAAGEAILGIGQRLNEAKRVLPRGQWLPWLTEKVEFSERTAQQFMQLAREWSNPQALADLGKSKALSLLALPAEERERFIAQPHRVNGEEKTVVDMTSRELEKAIRERREAIEENERLKQQLEKLKTAPIEVAVMEVDQRALNNAKKAAFDEMRNAFTTLRTTVPAWTPGETEPEAACDAVAVFEVNGQHVRRFCSWNGKAWCFDQVGVKIEMQPLKWLALPPDEEEA